jgi:transcriptional regulator with XRE-family HTH domain
MAIKDVLPLLRHERGMTQEELASKLFVTRQAVSRWENGDTAPNIDMTKLLASVLEVPVSRLLELPEFSCQSCGMPITEPSEQGTEADGTLSDEFCVHCYKDGAFTFETDLDNMIENCAPFLMKQFDMTHDEAVSLMGALLPNLKRWKRERAEETTHQR